MKPPGRLELIVLSILSGAFLLVVAFGISYNPTPGPIVPASGSDNVAVVADPGEPEIINYDLQLRRPTFAQVQDFLATDNTSSIELTGAPVPGQPVNCLTYSTTFRERAIDQHLWAYIVIFNWSAGLENPGITGWHAINAFDTTDLGLVYVEPSTDKVVDLKIGKDYSEELCAAGKWCPLFPMFVKQIGIAR